MSEFQYYFAQREAIETIVYLYDVVGMQDKYDLMRFDNSGTVSSGMFDESWRRFVVKMATGSGKTKVLSLALAWSFFHKLYEPASGLARNFLVIAPNIIVLCKPQWNEGSRGFALGLLRRELAQVIRVGWIGRGNWGAHDELYRFVSAETDRRPPSGHGICACYRVCDYASSHGYRLALQGHEGRAAGGSPDKFSQFIRPTTPRRARLAAK
jgi:hypothetical protein